MKDIVLGFSDAFVRLPVHPSVRHSVKRELNFWPELERNRIKNINLCCLGHGSETELGTLSDLENSDGYVVVSE